MKTFIILITISLVTVMVTSSPIAGSVRPIVDQGIQRRSAPVKGGWADVKGYATPPGPLYYKVRKGEYVCGDRICKLQPGVVPKGCNGVCQYPL